MLRCQIDFEFFVKRVIGEIDGQPIKFAPFHNEWAWAAENCKRTLIIAPTGFHKTGMMGVCYPIWYLWRNTYKEILYIAQILEKAEETLAKANTVMGDNELLKNMLPKEWNKHDIHYTNKCRSICRAFAETVKGVHVDKVICDELSQYEQKSIYNSAIITRVERKLGNVIGITTPISETDLSMELFEKYRKEMLSGNLDYFAKIYPAEDGMGGNLLWSEEFPLERLQRIRRDLGEWAYHQQYLCSPIPFGSMFFPLDVIQPCFDENYKLSIEPPNLPGDNYLGVDLAIAASADAANTGYIGIKKLAGGKLLVTHIDWQKGFKPELNKQNILSLNTSHKFFQIWVDEAVFGPSYTESLINAGLPIWGIPFNVYKYRYDTLSNLRIQFERKSLIIPDAKDDFTQFRNKQLKKELLSMALVKTEKSEMPTVKSVGTTSDLVMALALAVKGASEQRPYLDITEVGTMPHQTSFG